MKTFAKWFHSCFQHSKLKTELQWTRAGDKWNFLLVCTLPVEVWAAYLFLVCPFGFSSGGSSIMSWQDWAWSKLFGVFGEHWVSNINTCTGRERYCSECHHPWPASTRDQLDGRPSARGVLFLLNFSPLKWGQWRFPTWYICRVKWINTCINTCRALEE